MSYPGPSTPPRRPPPPPMPSLPPGAMHPSFFGTPPRPPGSSAFRPYPSPPNGHPDHAPLYPAPGRLSNGTRYDPQEGFRNEAVDWYGYSTDGIARPYDNAGTLPRPYEYEIGAGPSRRPPPPPPPHPDFGGPPPANLSPAPSVTRRKLPTLPPQISGGGKLRTLPPIPQNRPPPPIPPPPRFVDHIQDGLPPLVPPSHPLHSPVPPRRSLERLDGSLFSNPSPPPSRSTSSNFSYEAVPSAGGSAMSISSSTGSNPFSDYSMVSSHSSPIPPSSNDRAPLSPGSNEATSEQSTLMTLDGRRTPNQRDWLADGVWNMHVGHQRTPSAVSAIDAGLPATPKVLPTTSLHRQEASVSPILASPQVSERVAMPIPVIKVPTPIPSGEFSRRSSHSDFRFATRPSMDSPISAGPSRANADKSVRRNSSARSSQQLTANSSRRVSSELSASWAQQSQPPSNWVQHKLQIHEGQRDDLFDDQGDMDGSLRRLSESAYYDDWDDGEEEAEVPESQFFHPALLSEVAFQARDRVVKGRHFKAAIPCDGSFTGRDLVSAIQSVLPAFTRESDNDRRFALLAARSLQTQLWCEEFDRDSRPLRDSTEEIFRFTSEIVGMGAGDGLYTELPTDILTMATRCYSPSCPSNSTCYSPRCPYKLRPSSFLPAHEAIPQVPTPIVPQESWHQDLDPKLLAELSPEAVTRQTIITQTINSEVLYQADLAAMETFFINGLRQMDPPLIPYGRLEAFISEVFCNASELRQACELLIESFAIRRLESGSAVTMAVGDIFLQAAVEFREIYPDYTGNLPKAEAVLKKEFDENVDFRLYCERIVRENDRRYDIRLLITRPSTQLQRYPAVIEALLDATSPHEADYDFLSAALTNIRNLSYLSQLKLFHASKGRGPAGRLKWHNLITQEQRDLMDVKEQKRQMQIWELIQTEMEYVNDLEVMDTLFVDGLRTADVPIIDRSRLDTFLHDVFHNYQSILELHKFLLEDLQARQLKEHPEIGAIGDLYLSAVLEFHGWREAYMEYVTHYPIAKAKVEEEKARNPRFVAFLDDLLRNPLTNRQNIVHFIYRPLPRLVRYKMLFEGIVKSLKELGQPNHPDVETLEQVWELNADLSHNAEKGVDINNAKVELWDYARTLNASKFGARTMKDLDLLNPMRELVHKGRVFRQPESSMSSSWSELIVLLFDNYLVIAKPEKLAKAAKNTDRQIQYFVNRRPIPLELLSIGNFADAPRSRGGRTAGVFGLRGDHDDINEGGSRESESRIVWPFTISFIGQGQLGGQYTLWTDSYASRADWQQKLLHAKVMRAEVNDASKIFEMVSLSQNTFWMSANYAAPKTNGEASFTGRVTCSMPFVTSEGRYLIAIGCEEGVWIGVRHDTGSLRKVLHVKSVTQIAVLEEFGIFLVLQEQCLLAYHLEALVPTATSPQLSAAPQRLNPNKDVSFFAVGQLSGRTLVLYMKKKGTDSIFRVLEPILGRNVEDTTRQRRPFGSLLGQRADWFRPYKDFFIPTEALGVHFLKHKLAVVCAKGFEIMDLTDLKGGSVPIFDSTKVRESPLLRDLQSRCESAKPLGMFRSTETEFLLCYDSFGMYVDRHGEPNRGCQALEWEGMPDSVAFHPPFVLLISTPFIEIRHIDTGMLLQIVTGSDIRLTWDGTGGMLKPFLDNPGPTGYGDEATTQEPRVHICKRPDDSKRARGTGGLVEQNVFELNPTLLLNNPLLNPIHGHDSNYFAPTPMMSHSSSGSITLRDRRSPSMYTSSSDYNGTPEGVR